MKITSKDINNFNRRVYPSFNEEYNKQNGIYSNDVYTFLKKIQSAASGIMNSPLTMKDIKKHQDYI